MLINVVLQTNGDARCLLLGTRIETSTPTVVFRRVLTGYLEHPHVCIFQISQATATIFNDRHRTFFRILRCRLYHFNFQCREFRVIVFWRKRYQFYPHVYQFASRSRKLFHFVHIVTFNLQLLI